MSWRTVIITTQSKLDYKMGYMVVRGKETHRIFLDEIAILLIENPMVSLTGCLVTALIEKKIRIVFCDEKRNPAAELTPHHGSHDSTAKIRMQAVWTAEVKALVWREIVADKIRKQANFLNELGKEKEAELLQTYISKIEPSDTTNREGHAAKVYFNALFGKDFTRGADNSINAALNYGYSLVLSAVNREISNNGYLTQLGIFHNNMFNPYNLGCDLMEPLRVLVDRRVRKEMPLEFGKEEKHEMWRILEDTVTIERYHQSLLNAIRIYVHSIFEALNDGDPSKVCFFEIE